ncbi:hypothetical protein [Polaribacter sp. Q13]|uniref:hypothetical protein n=1 Tax=Polaribacter sp. Q13 TaxID=2806551 RepID=UPI00193B61F8|nr:hypothetical protein [Polaribacter sp. Q13]QVY66625.1 hypothetical protein JOP69_04885 [Polaribacter sp. Q13]
MNKATILKLLPISIIFIAVLSLEPYTSLPIKNTTIWWLIKSLILYLFWRFKYYFFKPRNAKAMIIVMVYLWWNIFSSFRGVFIAETYWDFKGLFGNALALLLPLLAFVATDKHIVQSILRFYIIYGLPIFILFIPFIPTGAYGQYLVVVSLFLLFLPVLTKKWQIGILTLSILVILINLGARSYVIKFVVALFLMLIYYFRLFISKWIIDSVRLVFLFAPIILFVFATMGTFNVFKMGDYIEGDYMEVSRNSEGEIEEANLKTDTRSFLYVEVLQSAQNHNSWLIGRSPARGNDTEAFSEIAEVTGRKERLGNEVGILNIFTWTGVVGVILYFLVFWKASYVAINQSKNIFSKMLGLFVAFRWAFSWVEDINNFTLNYVLLWLMIGMCFSKSFRKMSDIEVKIWVRGIFEKRYRKLEYFINKRK